MHKTKKRDILKKKKICIICLFHMYIIVLKINISKYIWFYKTENNKLIQLRKKVSVQMVLNLVNALLRLSNFIELM